MKKYLYLLALVLVLSIGTLTAGHLWVNSARDRLDIAETVLKGDPAAAEGLFVTYHIQDKDGHLLWKTVFTPGGTEQAETDFRFSGDGEEEKYPWRFTIELDHIIDTFGIVDGSMLDEDAGDTWMVLPVRDVASRTAAGEKRTEIIRLADYYEYYFPMEFTAPNFDHQFPVGVTGAEEKRLDEYFRYKVEEDIVREVTVVKDSSGNINTIESRLQDGDYLFDEGYLFSEGTGTEDGIFLIAESYDADGQPDGRLQCPDGPGVHFIPALPEEQRDSEVWFDLSRIQLFYPTGDARALRLTLSPDEQKLLLYTEENGALVLTVLDPSTGDVLQRLDLLDSGIGTDLTLIETGDLCLALPEESDQFSLVSGESGRYVQVLRGEFGVSESVREMMTWEGRFPVVVWDGERMALVAAFIIPSQSEHDTTVGVWDASGLRFLGRYDYGPNRDPMPQQQIGQYRSFGDYLSAAFKRK